MSLFDKTLITTIYLFPLVMIILGVAACFSYRKKRKKLLLVAGFLLIILGIYFGFIQSFNPVKKNRSEINFSHSKVMTLFFQTSEEMKINCDSLEVNIKKLQILSRNGHKIAEHFKKFSKYSQKCGPDLGPQMVLVRYYDKEVFDSKSYLKWM